MNDTPTEADDFAKRKDQLAEAVTRSRTLIEESRELIDRLAARSRRDDARQTDISFSTFHRLLRTEGVRPALHFLLNLTDYRFIGIFRFQDGFATSAVHIDQDDPSILQAAEVPDTATYCCYVRDGNGSFVTADALADPRTAGHPAREVVRAYCGIPVMDPEGGLIGTLCHYDLVPRDPEQLDLELLLRASSALAQSGLVPHYPARR